MAIEKWLAVTSVALFTMFAGEMISVYNFMTSMPEDFAYLESFSADPKILQFISIGVAPAGILAAVAFIMSRQYGSRQIGGMIVAGGAVLLAGMFFCHSLIGQIEETHITDAVRHTPSLFMALSAPVIGVGLSLFKRKKRRPKKEFF